jgi:ABC-type Fe3+ transport system permease subunit
MYLTYLPHFFHSLLHSLTNWQSFTRFQIQAQATPQKWEQIDEHCVTKGDVATIQGIMCLLANVLRVALPLIGITGFIMMVYGSLTWLLSGGDSQAVEKARNSMIFAVVGLVLALSSFIIINLLAKFTGVDTIQKFFIPNSDYEWSSNL